MIIDTDHSGWIDLDAAGLSKCLCIATPLSVQDYLAESSPPTSQLCQGVCFWLYAATWAGQEPPASADEPRAYRQMTSYNFLNMCSYAPDDAAGPSMLEHLYRQLKWRFQEGFVASFQDLFGFAAQACPCPCVV